MNGAGGCFARCVSPFAARCCLVGAAVVLAVVGVFGSLPGTGRAALLVAAACCGGLDVVVARTTTTQAAPAATPPVLVASGASVACTPVGPDSDVVDPLAPGGGAAPGVLLGRHPDGTTVRVGTGATGAGPSGAGLPGADPSGTCHLVVVGVGALAEAVFVALRAQLGHHGDHPSDDAEVRTASGARLVAAARGGVGRVPPGTAVAARIAAAGPPRSTVVLVPGAHLLPRRWDHLVEVSRHGCRVQRHPDAAPVAIDPVLPLLVD